MHEILKKFRRDEKVDRKVWMVRNISTGTISIAPFDDEPNPQNDNYISILVRVWDVGSDHLIIRNTKSDEYFMIPFSNITEVKLNELQLN